jgi:hypothetical protein
MTMNPDRIIVERLHDHWSAWFDGEPHIAFGGATPAEAVDRLVGFLSEPVVFDFARAARFYADLCRRRADSSPSSILLDSKGAFHVGPCGHHHRVSIAHVR